MHREGMIMAEHYNFMDTLRELADLIELMTIQLMRNEMDDHKNNIPKLSRLMEMCFPQIIVSYSDPILSEVSGDAVYWSEQIGRIIEALNMDDKFIRIDVLYQETRTNLLAFMDMIKGTKLADAEVYEPEMPENA